ncbi:MAG: alpha-keto acid decarboxylase family protein [Parachlamydiales bacterium]|nr:alpha-keto acid decarboxylase family protein [Parachlamydiales bacterium]
MEISIGDYLLKKLKNLNVSHIFGLPGDYNLLFLDQVIKNKSIKWVGCCNELNASYAADGYARINGVSCLITTFGVGELSATNGVAGAYAENVPIIHIVGMPSTLVQKQKRIMHHSLSDRKFDEFYHMYKKITCASAIICEKNAQTEIDRVFEKSIFHKKPGYLAIPVDLFHKKITIKKTKKIDTFSNVNTLKEASNVIYEKLQKAKNPVILIDYLINRDPQLKKLILKFLERTNIPFATTFLSKGSIDESHKSFLGRYAGKLSSKNVKKRIESSDAVIAIGFLPSDFSTGKFTHKLNKKNLIDIQINFTKVASSLYENVYFLDVFKELIKKINIKNIQHKEKVIPPEKLKFVKPKNDKITQISFWGRMQNFLKKDDIILAETGTSSFASLEMAMPDNVTYINQGQWGSIGYAQGSLLGTTTIRPNNRNILFIGDGSFQLTAQAMSTMLKNRLNPIIFLLNNDGYAIERIIHGWNMSYNDIQMWNYSELPKIFGQNVFSVKVKDHTQLEEALILLDKNKNKLRFIEVEMKKHDIPIILRKFLDKD